MMTVQDNAYHPDQISTPWKVWINLGWKEDPSIRFEQAEGSMRTQCVHLHRSITSAGLSPSVRRKEKQLLENEAGQAIQVLSEIVPPSGIQLCQVGGCARPDGPALWWQVPQLSHELSERMKWGLRNEAFECDDSHLPDGLTRLGLDDLVPVIEQVFGSQKQLVCSELAAALARRNREELTTSTLKQVEQLFEETDEDDSGILDSEEVVDLLEKILVAASEKMTAQSRVYIVRARTQLQGREFNFQGFLHLLCDPPWNLAIPQVMREIMPDVADLYQLEQLQKRISQHELQSLNRGCAAFRSRVMRQAWLKLVNFSAGIDRQGLAQCRAELEQELQRVVLGNQFGSINLAHLQSVVDRLKLDRSKLQSCADVLQEAEQLLAPLQKIRFAGCFDGSGGPLGTASWRRNPQLQLLFGSGVATEVHLSIHDVLGTLGQLSIQLCANNADSPFDVALPSCHLVDKSTFSDGASSLEYTHPATGDRRIFLVPTTKKSSVCGDFLITAVVSWQAKSNAPEPLDNHVPLGMSAVAVPKGFSVCVQHSIRRGRGGAYGTDTFTLNPQFKLSVVWRCSVALIVSRTGRDPVSIHLFQNLRPTHPNKPCRLRHNATERRLVAALPHYSKQQELAIELELDPCSAQQPYFVVVSRTDDLQLSEGTVTLTAFSQKSIQIEPVPHSKWKPARRVPFTPKCAEPQERTLSPVVLKPQEPRKARRGSRPQRRARKRQPTLQAQLHASPYNSPPEQARRYSVTPLYTQKEESLSETHISRGTCCNGMQYCPLSDPDETLASSWYCSSGASSTTDRHTSYSSPVGASLSTGTRTSCNSPPQAQSILQPCTPCSQLVYTDLSESDEADTAIENETRSNSALTDTNDPTGDAENDKTTGSSDVDDFIEEHEDSHSSSGDNVLYDDIALVQAVPRLRCLSARRPCSAMRRPDEAGSCTRSASETMTKMTPHAPLRVYHAKSESDVTRVRMER